MKWQWFWPHWWTGSEATTARTAYATAESSNLRQYKIFLKANFALVRILKLVPHLFWGLFATVAPSAANEPATPRERGKKGKLGSQIKISKQRRKSKKTLMPCSWPPACHKARVSPGWDSGMGSARPGMGSGQNCHSKLPHQEQTLLLIWFLLFSADGCWHLHFCCWL